MIESVIGDVRHACRAWRRSPLVALTLLSLNALGLGGVAALFSPLYTIVLSPLPFPQPERLVRIGGGVPLFDSYASEIADRQMLDAAFDGVAAYAPVPEGSLSRLATQTGLRDIALVAVTSEFFDVLRVAPRLGPGFSGERSNSRAVVLSHRLWVRELGSSAAAGSAVMRIGDIDRQVVGVMPPEFDFPEGTDAWVVMGSAPTGNIAVLQMIGRVRGELTIAQAAAHIGGLRHTRTERSRGRIGKDGPVLQSLHGFLHGERAFMLYAVWAVSILFLALASIGSANLLLARGAGLQQELAVRQVLGATRWRLVRQLLIETMVIVASGAVLALWLSVLLNRWLTAHVSAIAGVAKFAPATVPLVAGLTLLLTVLCGLAPALLATSVRLSGAMQTGVGHREIVGARRRPTAREVMAAAQLTTAMVLLVTTLLLLKSLIAQIQMPLGFRAADTAVISVDLPATRALADARESFYRDHGMDPSGTYGPRTHRQLLEDMRRTLEPVQSAEAARNINFFAAGRDRLLGLAGVGSVAVLAPAPLTSDSTRAVQSSMPVYKADPKATQTLPPYVVTVHGRATSNAFDVLGASLVAGRMLNDADVSEELAQQLNASCKQCSGQTDVGSAEEQPGVAVVNEALARALWKDEGAVGKRFFDPPFRPRIVVGVVADFRQSGYTLDIKPAAFYPFTGIGSRATFLVRASSDGALSRLADRANAALVAIEPTLTPTPAPTLDELAVASLGNMRFAVSVLSLFACLGLVVAGFGVYASSTLMAKSRRREMAIRVALGATAGQVRWLLFRRCVALTVAAVSSGWLLAWAGSSQIQHMLFRVTTNDAASVSVSSAIVLAVAFLAGLIPAVRAGQEDPNRVLQNG